VDEHRRHVDWRLEEVHVGPFDRARREQPVAETQQDAVTVPRIRVFDFQDFFFTHRTAWGRHQRRVKSELAFAGLLYRVDLRTQVVRAQEVVGDPEAAAGVTLQE